MSSARKSPVPLEVCPVPRFPSLPLPMQATAMLRFLAIFVIALWPVIRPMPVRAQSQRTVATQNVVNRDAESARLHLR